MTDTRLEITDSRRLTGPNLLLEGAGAILDVAIAGVATRDVCRAWRRHATDLLAAVGWATATTAVREHPRGASLAFTAPIDVLYAATEVNETAWGAAVAEVTGAADPRPGEAVVTRLRRVVADERDPDRLALQAAARSHDVAFLWDDDEVSVGLGSGSVTFDAGRLPDPGAVEWGSRHDVHVALVTGTNGKSTTVRMLAAILARDGRRTGSTSTDGIVVGGDTVDVGDWSGPGGARRLLRDRRVEAGVLEVARGGILRRGLPLERADVAVVTNVAADHLGEYGVDTVADLAQAKLVVARAVRDRGGLVVNAGSAPIVAARPSAAEVAWFARDPDNDVLRDHLAASGRGWTVVDGDLVESAGGVVTPIVAVDAIPATYGGSAGHNVENALAAAGAARILGVATATIAASLARFTATVEDNPGRANLFDLDGATVIVDFAHNPHGMAAIAAMAEAMPARRRIVLFGQAGDRGDDEIRVLARRVAAIDPVHVVAIELPAYRRGRDELEIPRLIRDELVAGGMDVGTVTLAPTPVEGVRVALDLATEGDLLVLMVLDQRQAAVDLLRERGAVPRGRA